MLLSLLTTFFIQAQAPTAEERANHHLQDAYLRQRRMQDKADIAIIQGDGVEIPQEYEDTSGNIGIIREAPEEALPNFDSPSPTYGANPLEQSFQDAERQRQYEADKLRRQRKFVEQYKRNAEKDGVELQINDDLVIENYRRMNPPAPRRKPSNGAGK